MNRINELLEQYKQDATAQGMIRALGVFVLDPRLAALIKGCDPQALRQARTALGMPDETAAPVITTVKVLATYETPVAVEDLDEAE